MSSFLFEDIWRFPKSSCPYMSILHHANIIFQSPRSLLIFSSHNGQLRRLRRLRSLISQRCPAVPSGAQDSAQDNGQTWQSPMAGMDRSGEIFMERDFENQPRSLTHSSHSITVRCFLWSQCLLLARLGLFQKGVQAARASWPDQKRAILLAVTGPLGACRILCSRTFSSSQMNQNRRLKQTNELWMFLFWFKTLEGLCYTDSFSQNSVIWLKNSL